ncbi:MAG: hypothetical protein A2Y62_18615 [Candidatus Fischerbacteria bacterium RBG_13_37_8]|uniref:PepSY domain-containing protein n=1 Tax=Candidatus Fischerbacteria bacterium RBG_13_37_8 TaxID=1817863 RepID=A0A1F5V4Z2_9BACT|nr:MAG: hypothetical protein A2Y62_18615 [Candidatus Fischerbacteria bacterium RBG_13_37_8]
MKRLSTLILVLALAICSTAKAEKKRTLKAEEKLTFKKVEYFKLVEGKDKPEKIKGELIFDSGKQTISFLSEKKEKIDVNYADVTELIYEKTKKPRYALGLIFAWPLLFTKSKSHYLTINYKVEEKGQYMLLKMDKRNYQMIIATIEAETGKKVERIVDD